MILTEVMTVKDHWKRNFEVTGAFISYLTSFLMFILRDQSYKMTKLSYMIKKFQIDVEMRTEKHSHRRYLNATEKDSLIFHEQNSKEIHF